MKNVFLMLTLLLPPGTSLSAAPVAATLEAFAHRYAEVVRGGNVDTYKQLLHPKLLACVGRENQDYYQLMLRWRQWRTAEAPQVKVKVLQENPFLKKAEKDLRA